MSQPSTPQTALATLVGSTNDQVRKVKRGLRVAWNGIHAIAHHNRELFAYLQELEARVRELELSRHRIEEHLEDQGDYERE